MGSDGMGSGCPDHPRTSSSLRQGLRHGAHPRAKTACAAVAAPALRGLDPGSDTASTARRMSVQSCMSVNTPFSCSRSATLQDRSLGGDPSGTRDLWSVDLFDRPFSGRRCSPFQPAFTPALEHAKMDATQTDGLGPMVVWRAERRRRPRAECASVHAAAMTSRTAHCVPGHAHYAGTADERRMSPN